MEGPRVTFVKKTGQFAFGVLAKLIEKATTRDLVRELKGHL
jgi:hypothetical protein